MDYPQKDLTEKIIRCFYEVYNQLGYGFLEKVYERSMLVELTNAGLSANKQVPIAVFYKGESVGEYFADIIVNNLVVVEVKAADAIAEEHELQLINYLRATDVEVGLLLNFGKKPEVRRKVFSNDRKGKEFPSSPKKLQT
jgi:GxxExxY protein